MSMFIAIEGSAGTGKTTLAVALATALGMRPVLEPGNDELANLYHEIASSPLRVQLNCLAHRLRQQHAIKRHRSLGSGVISDFLFCKDRVYAEIWLAPDDFNAYAKLFDVVNMTAEVPDVLIYLEAPVDFLVRRIQVRSRAFETFVDSVFLTRLAVSTSKHVLDQGIRNTVVLNSTDFDIVARPNELIEIVDTLRRYF